MSHFDNSGSEDGQLQSPGYIDNTASGGEEVEPAESLDIKPPQAARDITRKKTSYKEKKHSREHRHKDRDRERMIRDREKDRIDDRRHRHSGNTSGGGGGGGGGGGVGGGGGGGSGGLGRDREKHHRRDHHNREHHEYYNRHKERERDMRHDRNDIRDRDRRKFIEQYENKNDVDKALDDLRTRILKKRNKYEQEAATRYDDHPHDRISRTMGSDHRRGGGEHRDRRENIIELIDSPEHYSDYNNSTGRKKDKKIFQEDPEQVARRAKLLEAEREMARRKELARDELEARRELRRGRGEISPSPTRQKSKSKRKSKLSDEEVEEKVNRKRLKKASPKEEGEYVEKGVVEVSDVSNKSSPESLHENDDDTDSESGSISQSSESEKEGRRSGEEEDLLPSSPLSVGELTKSDHRRHSGSRSRSRSRSHSVMSRSRSHSARSKSHHSRSRSKTRSRSRSRSRSDRSLTKSHSRSRSRSRSLSDKEKDLDIEINSDDDDDMIAVEKDGENKIKDDASGDKSKDNTDANKEKQEIDNSPKDEKGEKLPNYYPGIQGCRSVEEFQCLNRIEEGTYGVVYRAKDKRTNEIVALKRLKMEKEKEGFPITSLREINTLLKGQHPNIVTVREIVVGSNMDKIFIVMDYVEHDLKSLMETMKQKDHSFFAGEVKCLIQQLLRAVAHLHDNWILHRDLKTSNLLLSHKGILKVGDFGLAREYGSPLKAYTSLVVTLWYRAPELLLCSKEYSTPIDMWSVGCILAEFLQMGPLFPGKSEIDQLNRIFKELGTPNEKIWPGYKNLPAVQSLLSQNSHFTEYPVSNLHRRFAKKTTDLGHQLLQGLLTYDPKQRLTAEHALKTPFFKELPLPIDPSMFPTWPAKSELGARKALASSPKPPSGGGQFKQLGRDDITAATNNQTGFVLAAGMDKRQLAMGPGFNLKF